MDIGYIVGPIVPQRGRCVGHSDKSIFFNQKFKVEMKLGRAAWQRRTQRRATNTNPSSSTESMLSPEPLVMAIVCKHRARACRRDNDDHGRMADGGTWGWGKRGCILPRCRLFFFPSATVLALVARLADARCADFAGGHLPYVCICDVDRVNEPATVCVQRALVSKSVSRTNRACTIQFTYT